MNDIEKRLALYRRKEKRDKIIQAVYSPFTRIFSFFNIFRYFEGIPNSKYEAVKSNGFISDHNVDEDDAVGVPEPLTDDELDSLEVCNWTRVLFYCTVWCTLFGIAVYVEFGVVYIIISGFYIIWTNTSTRPKYRNEISAYSVFNPNCTPIEGTLDAEKLQNEMLLGALH